MQSVKLKIYETFFNILSARLSNKICSLKLIFLTNGVAFILPGPLISLPGKSGIDILLLHRVRVRNKFSMPPKYIRAEFVSI